MNVVTLIGNLATEVELREVRPDKKVASFVLAVDRANQDGGADFVRVSAWDRQAELCAEYLGKGRRIAEIVPGVRPSMRFASIPTACTSPLRWSIATTEGSERTMPRPRT